MFIGSKSLCPILPELHPITPQSQSQSRRSNHTSASGEHMLLPIVGTIAGGKILQTQYHLLQRGWEEKARLWFNFYYKIDSLLCVCGDVHLSVTNHGFFTLREPVRNEAWQLSKSVAAYWYIHKLFMNKQIQTEEAGRWEVMRIEWLLQRYRSKRNWHALPWQLNHETLTALAVDMTWHFFTVYRDHLA